MALTWYHYHLGLAYRGLGDDDRAKAAFSQALEIDPKFPNAAEARAQLAD